jgi:MFS family permease
VFGGCVMACAPLLAVLMLRDLGFAPWQYGLALGLQCVGGLAGAAAVRPLRRRFGERPVLLGTGAARALWLVFLPLTPAGPAGLAVIAGSQVLMLFCAGAFNPTFFTHRMNATPDGALSRVLAAWSISSRVVQPLVIAAGGLLAAALGTRAAMVVLAALLLTSVALLPWRAVRPAGVPAGR